MPLCDLVVVYVGSVYLLFILLFYLELLLSIIVYSS